MAIKALIEGGQLTFHRFRMLRQVLRNMTTISFAISVFYVFFQFLFVPIGHWNALYYATLAETKTYFSNAKKIEVDKDFWKWISNNSYAKNPILSIELVKNKCAQKNYILRGRIWKVLEDSGTTFSIAFALSGLFFFVTGSLTSRKKHLSGKKIQRAWRLKWKLLFEGKASKIKIGTLPLLAGTETQHILVSGGTGSGKTTCFHSILPKVREEKQKAVVVDTTGSFISKYYRPEKDFILNPFDERAQTWHPWIECQTPIDYESLAKSFIPPSHHENENYWRQAASDLFSSVLLKRAHEQNSQELARILLKAPLEALCKEVEETKAAAHLSSSSEKTAASIRSVATSFLSCLEHLKNTSNPFSIRKWIENASTDSWLFISSKVGERAALNPLISSWTSLAIRNLIQCQPDINRRLWFVIDELPSLQKLKDLETLLTEGRKFGACALLAIQSPAQIEAIYGHHIAKVILGNCSTRVAFSEQDPQIAHQISQIFGEYEYMEVQEGLSYGANDMRDGVNLSKHEKRKAVVSASLIQALKQRQAFVKLPGNLPISKITI